MLIRKSKADHKTFLQRIMLLLLICDVNVKFAFIQNHLMISQKFIIFTICRKIYWLFVSTSLTSICIFKYLSIKKESRAASCLSYDAHFLWVCQYQFENQMLWLSGTHYHLLHVDQISAYTCMAQKKVS